MAKVDLGPLATSATGTVGTTTFRKRKGETVVSRKPTIHHNARDYFMNAQNAMRRANEFWGYLGSAGPGVGWEATVDFFDIWNMFTTRRGVTGREIFLGTYINRALEFNNSIEIPLTFGSGRGRTAQDISIQIRNNRSVNVVFQTPKTLPYEHVEMGAIAYCLNDYLPLSPRPLGNLTIVYGEFDGLEPDTLYAIELIIPEYRPSWGENIVYGVTIYFTTDSFPGRIFYGNSFLRKAIIPD